MTGAGAGHGRAATHVSLDMISAAVPCVMAALSARLPLLSSYNLISLSAGSTLAALAPPLAMMARTLSCMGTPARVVDSAGSGRR